MKWNSILQAHRIETNINPKFQLGIWDLSKWGVTFVTQYYPEMYLLKIKGKAKIPDYIQLRDDNFTLKAYFRVDRPEKSISKFDLNQEQVEKLLRYINESPFGIVQKLELWTRHRHSQPWKTSPFSSEEIWFYLM